MHVDRTWLRDDQGRTLILRGANLGGSTKIPYRFDGATYRREGFFEHRHVSFVGRPFWHDPAVRAPTEILIPNYQYPDGYTVQVSDGTYEIDRANQALIYRHTAGRDVHHICVQCPGGRFRQQ